jgi:hypothetical protein
MNTVKSENNVAERLRIQEKALSNLADALKKHEDAAGEEIRDLQAEVKALKMFLARSTPEFKTQFAELQRKVK